MSETLFTPTTFGDIRLANRVVMAPLTRRRADAGAVPSPSAALYYAQRAGAGLIVSEGVCISPEAIGDRRLPGLWTADHVNAWRVVTDAVHAQQGSIVAQLWHTGRGSHPSLQPDGVLPVAPSAIAIDKTRELDGEIVPSAVPRALETDEIPRVVSDYAIAARNAIAAGFDGVELHGANGYLIDEFLQDSSNRRTDAYGGSVENRVRFLADVLEAVTQEIGSGRVGLRISPSSTFQSMHDSDPHALWGRVLVVVRGFGLAYLHVVEPGISGSENHRSNADDIDSAWVRRRYVGALVAAGRYDAATAEEAVHSGRLDAVAFGRLYTSNPDLSERLRERAPLTDPHRPTFYTADDEGYIDWPTLRAEAILRGLQDGTVDVEVLRADREAPATGIHDKWELEWALARYERAPR